MESMGKGIVSVDRNNRGQCLLSVWVVWFQNVFCGGRGSALKDYTSFTPDPQIPRLRIDFEVLTGNVSKFRQWPDSCRLVRSSLHQWHKCSIHKHSFQPATQVLWPILQWNRRSLPCFRLPPSAGFRSLNHFWNLLRCISTPSRFLNPFERGYYLLRFPHSTRSYNALEIIQANPPCCETVKLLKYIQYVTGRHSYLYLTGSKIPTDNYNVVLIYLSVL